MYLLKDRNGVLERAGKAKKKKRFSFSLDNTYLTSETKMTLVPVFKENEYFSYIRLPAEKKKNHYFIYEMTRKSDRP